MSQVNVASILEFVKNYPIPPFMIAQKLKCSEENVKKCLEHLEQNGMVQSFDICLLGRQERTYFH
jgi:biotin operon repressor